jgi:hypothetical protein
MGRAPCLSPAHYLALPVDERKLTSATPRAAFRFLSLPAFAFGFGLADRPFRRTQKEAGPGIALLGGEFVDLLTASSSSGAVMLTGTALAVAGGALTRMATASRFSRSAITASSEEGSGIGS